MLFICLVVQVTRATLTCDQVAQILKAEGIIITCIGQRPLGAGCSGSTYKVGFKGAILALKFVEIQNEFQKQKFNREVYRLANLPPHPNLVEYFGSKKIHTTTVAKSIVATAPVEKDYGFVFLSLGKNGSLQSYIIREYKRFRSPSVILSTFKMIVEGVEHLHNNKALHGDLKPENIIMDEMGRPRLIDLEYSPKIGDDGPGVGTIFYMDPVHLRELKTFKKVKYAPYQDVHALGIVLYQLAHQGRVPFYGPTIDTYVDSILQGKYTIDAGVHWLVMVIISKCLQEDPKKRWTTQDIIKYIDLHQEDVQNYPNIVLSAFKPMNTKAEYSYTKYRDIQNAQIQKEKDRQAELQRIAEEQKRIDETRLANLAEAIQYREYIHNGIKEDERNRLKKVKDDVLNLPPIHIGTTKLIKGRGKTPRARLDTPVGNSGAKTERHVDFKKISKEDKQEDEAIGKLYEEVMGDRSGSLSKLTDGFMKDINGFIRKEKEKEHKLFNSIIRQADYDTAKIMKGVDDALKFPRNLAKFAGVPNSDVTLLAAAPQKGSLNLV